MQGKDVWLLAVLLGALALPGSQACAQHEAAGPAGAQQQSVQASRYGRGSDCPETATSSICPTTPIHVFRCRRATKPMPMWTG